MLADLLINPDFKAFMADVEAIRERHKVALESAKDWEEVARTQSALSALRTVLDLPQQKAKAAADADEIKRLSDRRTRG